MGCAEEGRPGLTQKVKMKNSIAIVTLLLTLLAEAQSVNPEVAQAVRGSVLLRDQMRDPDSFVIEKVFTLKNKKGVEITCFEYRSKNGFGGMNRDTALYMEYKGKPHVDMSGLGGSWAVTKNHPYVDITKEFREAAKTR
jgi:hypothetical protein